MVQKLKLIIQENRDDTEKSSRQIKTTYVNIGGLTLSKFNTIIEVAESNKTDIIFISETWRDTIPRININYELQSIKKAIPLVNNKRKKEGMMLLTRKGINIKKIIEIKYGLAIKCKSDWIIALYASPNQSLIIKDIIPEKLINKIKNSNITLIGDINILDNSRQEIDLINEYFCLGLEKKYFPKPTFQRLGKSSYPDKLYSNHPIDYKLYRTCNIDHSFISFSKQIKDPNEMLYGYKIGLFNKNKKKIQAKMNKLEIETIVEPAIDNEEKNITEIILKSFSSTKKLKIKNNIIIPEIIKVLKKRKNKLRKDKNRDINVLNEIKELISSLFKNLKKPENIRRLPTNKYEVKLTKSTNSKHKSNIKTKSKERLNSIAESLLIKGEHYDYTELIREIPEDTFPLEPFENEEVQEEIKKLRGNKASGASGIRNEMLKLLTTPMLVRLTNFFNLLTSTKKIPLSWKTILIHPIPKKEKNTYRPIALTECIRKLFEKMIKKRLERTVRINVQQGGFTKGRSVQDQLLILDNELRRSNGGLIAVTLDIKAAYDSIDRRLLYKKLKNETSLGIQRLIIELNEKNTIQIRNNNLISDKFDLVMGVPQGTILSPILFNVFINDIFESVSESQKRKILLFADDILIFSHELDEIKQILKALEIHQNDNKYLFNPRKCYYMATGEKEIMINNQRIERQIKLKYLGMFFNNKGLDIKRTISDTQKKSLQVTNKIKEIYKYTIKRIQPELLIKIYKTHIRPILEFPLSLIGNAKTGLNDLEKLQKRIIKKILKIPQNCPTIVLYGLVEVEKLEQRIKILNRSLFKRILNNKNNPTAALFNARTTATKIIKAIKGNMADKELTKKKLKEIMLQENKVLLFGERDYGIYRMKFEGINKNWHKIIVENCQKIKFDDIIEKENIISTIKKEILEISARR